MYRGRTLTLSFPPFTFCEAHHHRQRRYLFSASPAWRLLAAWRAVFRTLCGPGAWSGNPLWDDLATPDVFLSAWQRWPRPDQYADAVDVRRPGGARLGAEALY